MYLVRWARQHWPAMLIWTLVIFGALHLLAVIDERGVALIRRGRFNREAITAYVWALVPFWMAAVLAQQTVAARSQQEAA